MILGQLRSGAWLDAARVAGYGRLLLVLEIIAMIVLAAGTYGLIVPLDRPASTDFISFYAAGHLADQGTPALAYDQPSHRLAERTVFGDADLPYDYWFFYPPTYLVYCALAAHLPYLVGVFAWGAVTGALYVFALRPILQRR